MWMGCGGPGPGNGSAGAFILIGGKMVALKSVILFVIIGFIFSGCSEEKVKWEPNKSYTFDYSAGSDQIELFSVIDNSYEGVPGIQVKFRLTNNGKESREYKRKQFVLQDKDGRFFTAIDEDPGLWSLNPLEETYPTILFAVPKKLTQGEFHFGYKEDDKLCYGIIINLYDDSYVHNYIYNVTIKRLETQFDEEFQNFCSMEKFNVERADSFIFMSRKRVNVDLETLNFIRDQSQNIVTSTFSQYRKYDVSTKIKALDESKMFLMTFEKFLQTKGFKLTTIKKEGHDYYCTGEGQGVDCCLDVRDINIPDQVSCFCSSIQFSRKGLFSN